MTNSRNFEIMVGVFVAMGMAAIFILAMQVSNLSDYSDDGGYIIKARFENIGGLKVRSQVTMAGVRVGRVAAINFDDTTYEAVVDLEVMDQYRKIPSDTSASIFTSGLLGEQYVGLEAGGEETFLSEGDQITLTQSALVLEQVIGQFLYSKASEGSSL